MGFNSEMMKICKRKDEGEKKMRGRGGEERGGNSLTILFCEEKKPSYY